MTPQATLHGFEQDLARPTDVEGEVHEAVIVDPDEREATARVSTDRIRPLNG